MTRFAESDPPRKVTVEDILRLKRAERPSPEFWGRFEQELRAKQLAAIIEKRPWWMALPFSRFAGGLGRLQLPVGAAAVLALSFMVVREYRPPVLSDFEANSPRVPSAVAPAQLSVQTSDNPAPWAPAAAQDGPVSLAPSQVASVIKSPEMSFSPSTPTRLDRPVSMERGSLMAMIPWAAPMGTNSAEEPVVGELPPVLFQSVTSPDRVDDFQGRVDIESGIMPVRVARAETTVAAAVPAASLREVRRNRILSNLVLADNTSEADGSRLGQVREVIASALDEDRLYDSVRRLGMGGDRLTLKF